jgi:phage shock protein C
MNKKLYRDEYHKVLGGVCAGLADYFEMDVTIVRLLFAFTIIIMGVGLGTYIILWIVLPKKGYIFNNYHNPTVDYTVPPQQPGAQFNTPPTQPGNPFEGNPFEKDPFTVNTPQGMQPKQRSNAGAIVGAVLIILGAAILTDEFDLIPDFDIGRLWPAILVVVGAILIVNGRDKHPSEMFGKQETEKTEGSPADDQSTTENSSL